MIFPNSLSSKNLCFLLVISISTSIGCGSSSQENDGGLDGAKNDASTSSADGDSDVDGDGDSDVDSDSDSDSESNYCVDRDGGNVEPVSVECSFTSEYWTMSIGGEKS